MNKECEGINGKVEKIIFKHNSVNNTLDGREKMNKKCTLKKRFPLTCNEVRL
jgi:hypothetical protein